MASVYILLIIHLIGFGILFTVTVAGWVLSTQYRKAKDPQTKILLLKSQQPLGILSPIGIAIMLASGIGNMVYLGLGPFSTGWLSAKLVFFLLLTLSGAVSGTRSVERTRLVAQLVDGKAPEAVTTRVDALDRQLRIFYVVQFVLLLIILTLSVARP